MASITEWMDMVCASLLSKPCTEEELFNRDFIKHIANYWKHKILQWLETDGKIYYKGDIIHVYKKVEKELENKGYYD